MTINRGRAPNLILMHLAFWLPLVFATPFSIAMRNSDDMAISLTTLAACLLLLAASLTALTHFLARSTGAIKYRRISMVFLGLGIVTVAQSNVIHGLFDYGQFNGESVDWHAYGWMFWVELYLFGAAILAVFVMAIRNVRIPAFLPWLPLLSSFVIVLPQAIDVIDQPASDIDQSFDDSVFALSSDTNLIHLLPDGFQSDIVAEVFEERPELTRQFSGFTLFRDHVGSFQNTAPSIPTIMTGRAFPLREGHSAKQTRDFIQKFGYQNELSTAGYRLDYVPTSQIFCIEQASSCVPRPFNDLKANGYFNPSTYDTGYSARLLADLTLFRYAPMFFKKLIYADGDWLLSRGGVSTGPPHPVFDDWIANMTVEDAMPRYKWYHFIGTHVPAQWNENCHFLGRLEASRENTKRQVRCVLDGIAGVLKRLDELGVYDQTAIVISADHGSILAAADLVGSELPAGLTPTLVGHARPAFLVKRIDDRAPLKVSDALTSLIDVAPTALDLVGLSGQFDGLSALDPKVDSGRPRTYILYDGRLAWQGVPVPYEEYSVNGPSYELDSWRLNDIVVTDAAPSKYSTWSDDLVSRFTRGGVLSEGDGGLGRLQTTSRQIAFLISRASEPDRSRLEIEVQVSDRHRARIRMNDRLLEGTLTVVPGAGDWQVASFAIPEDLLKGENNFVSLEFSDAVPTTQGNQAPLLLGSIQWR